MSPHPTASRLVAALAVRGQTLATAESLTGGLVGAAITSVPGASAVYLGGVISYATPMKTVLAGVSPDVLAAHGPVAGATAIAMAAGVRERTGADWALATTGVAGPDPQDGHAPGEVWLGVAGPDGLASSRHLHLSGGRDAIRAAAVAAALEFLCNLADGVA
ncbi:MAG TPA: CinA family protein [Propionicimonas sp.]|nr:CinA family protein [Propionicimonas sp.]HRA05047.1 CinA family protein [Propionicimonas sp.]